MILLTGAAGFIGKNLLKALINKNFKDIILVDDLNNKKKINILKTYQYNNLFDYREFISILNAKNLNIDAIFHFGANSNTTCKNKKLMNKETFNYRYGASNFKFSEISCSHRSPLAKSFSLSYINSSLVSVANSKFGPSTIASTGQDSSQRPQ